MFFSCFFFATMSCLLSIELEKNPKEKICCAQNKRNKSNIKKSDVFVGFFFSYLLFFSKTGSLVVVWYFNIASLCFVVVVFSVGALLVLKKL